MRILYLPLLTLMITATIWVTPAVNAASGSSSNVENSASGGGHYLVAGSLDVQFAFSAVLYRDGQVAGSFHDRTNDGLGLVDFDADVTCLAVDHDLGAHGSAASLPPTAQPVQISRTRFINQAMTSGSASWIQVKREASKTGEHLLASWERSPVPPSIAQLAPGPPTTHELGL
jgi:hypothetical protein